MINLHNIQVNTSSLADGHSLAAYLTSAAGTLLTHTTVGATQRLDVINLPDHLDGSAYAAGVDYLNSVGAVDESGNWLPLNINSAGELLVAATVNFAGDYAEDSAHSSGDVGLFTLSVRRDTRSSGTSADGDYASFNTNAVGELWVKDADVLARLVLINSDTTAILADTATIDSNVASLLAEVQGLSHAEDAAHVSGDMGIQPLLVRQDSLASSTSADGDYGAFKSNAAGELYVVDATARTTLASILADTATIDSQTLSIQNTLTALSKAEDAAHSSGDQGIQALAVRKDAQGSNVSADGDYSSLQTWSEGSLKVVDVANGSILQQQVSVSSTAAQVPAANLASRKRLLLQNTSAAKIWIGSATVTTSGATAGIELPANSSIELEAGPAVSVYAIKSGVGTLNLNVLEMA